MQEGLFERWLLAIRGLSHATVASRLSNCRRLETYEGDLDKHFEKDGMKGLLARLTYSMYDQRRSLPPRHRVPINGNIRNVTATLKSAANRYLSFRQHDDRQHDRRDRQPKSCLAHRSPRGRPTRTPPTGWPDWPQPDEADILKLAHTVAPLVKFLHPDIVAAVVEDNRHHLLDWRSKLAEVDIDPDIYLWEGSPCAFPGVRRYTKKEEPSFRDRTKNFPHSLWLDDNDFPKHLWAYVLTGRMFKKQGPRGYELAHLADHKEYKNRWRDEFSLDFQAAPPPLFGLYTSPANTVYVPNGFLRPTDFVNPLRALLLKRAYELYGRICTLAPPPLRERELDDSAWNPAHFTWGGPVGDVQKVDSFLEYRQREFNEGAKRRLEKRKEMSGRRSVRYEPSSSIHPPFCRTHSLP